MLYFYLAAAMLIVGSSVIVGKTITQDFPLFLASGLRFYIATLLLLPSGVYKGKLFRISRHDWFILLIMAFCGQILFTLLLLLGLRYTSAISASTLTSTTPFFMALISFALLAERFSLLQVGGLALAFSSIIFLGLDTFHALLDDDGLQLFGNLLVLAAVAGEAVFLLFSKKLERAFSGLELTAILSLLGFLMCLPFSLYEAGSFNFVELTFTDIMAMLYFGAIYTNLAYFCWFRGIVGSSGAVASAFTAVMPLSAALLSTILLGESISALQMVALSAAVSSILLLALAEKRKEIRDEAKC